MWVILIIVFIISVRLFFSYAFSIGLLIVLYYFLNVKGVRRTRSLHRSNVNVHTFKFIVIGWRDYWVT